MRKSRNQGRNVKEGYKGRKEGWNKGIKEGRNVKEGI